MYVAETGFFYIPRLTYFPTFPTGYTRFKPLAFNPNPGSTLFRQKSMRNSLVSQRGRGRVLRTMDNSNREDDDKAGSEGHGALEQEERNPLFGASSTLLNGVHPTLNRLSKWLVAALFTATLVGRHDAEALWAAIGSVMNTALSVVLKRILNQPRPNSSISSEPGMPSTHAQSISYVVVFVIWSLIEWLGVNDLSLVLSTLVLAWGSYISWLRVSQEYHTTRQVAVGSVVGLGFAFLWIWLWQAFIVRAFASYLWVRVVVTVASVLLCLCFLVHVIRHWLRQE